MSEHPERIWVGPRTGVVWSVPNDGCPEYIRADVATNKLLDVVSARNAVLDEVIAELDYHEIEHQDSAIRIVRAMKTEPAK